MYAVLPDRYVEGICPHCHEAARGDQCDACSAILDPLDLLEKKCKLCGSTPSVQKQSISISHCIHFRSKLKGL